MGELRRAYSSEFKREAVDLLQNSGKSISEVARDLGISTTNLSRWQKQLEESGDLSFPGHGKRILGTSDEEEIRRLKKELAIVREESNILEKAMAIFSKTPK